MGKKRKIYQEKQDLWISRKFTELWATHKFWTVEILEFLPRVWYNKFGTIKSHAYKTKIFVWGFVDLKINCKINWQDENHSSVKYHLYIKKPPAYLTEQNNDVKNHLKLVFISILLLAFLKNIWSPRYAKKIWESLLRNSILNNTR